MSHSPSSGPPRFREDSQSSGRLLLRRSDYTINGTGEGKGVMAYSVVPPHLMCENIKQRVLQVYDDSTSQDDQHHPGFLAVENPTENCQYSDLAIFLQQ